VDVAFGDAQLVLYFNRIMFIYQHPYYARCNKHLLFARRMENRRDGRTTLLVAERVNYVANSRWFGRWLVSDGGLPHSGVIICL